MAGMKVESLPIPTDEISIDLDSCNGCGQCIDECPVECISIKNKKAFISNECFGCGRCIDECPNEALSYN